MSNPTPPNNSNVKGAIIAALITAFASFAAVFLIFYLNNGTSNATRVNTDPSEEISQLREELEEVERQQKLKIREKIFKNQDNGDDGVYIEISYPEVYGMSDAEKQRKINYHIRLSAFAFEEGQNIEEDYDSGSVQSAYEVKENNDEYISILFRYSLYFGGPYVHYGQSSVNINIASGEPFQLKDLFRHGYKDELFKLIKESFRDRNVCGGGWTSLKGVNGNEDFTISRVNIEIHYDRNEALAGNCGAVTAIIPLRKLEHLINPNGPLGYLSY
ncbi:MAG: hypothetical protein GDA56_11855 [Hormoscilla sp. GM7CHS1pb]|nr:hypothetical protein [Hormoscilla sp. GM7CHS1pb]